MNTLEEWDFKKYSESVAKRHLNRNLKHIMKEGGRAGKALMINTDKLISTVQVLSVAGGAAKAAKAVSVSTGVMSALFLALDVFFLARDSHELRKGAKTKFATKLREVCKELQDGLLELNKVKCQLQKTMDGIEVEEYEEEGEEEESDEEEEEDDLVSDPVKLAELEQELDEIEEMLDQKVLEEPSKKEKDKWESKSEKVREKGTKSEKEKKNRTEKKEGTTESKSQIIEEDRRSIRSEGGGEDGAKLLKEQAKEEHKGQGSKVELSREAPQWSAGKDTSLKSSTKEREAKKDKEEEEEVEKKQMDRAREKVKEESQTKQTTWYTTDKPNQGAQDKQGSVRSVQSSTKDRSRGERPALKEEHNVPKTREEEEAAKMARARSERVTSDCKREIERQCASTKDGQRRREGSERGSRASADMKERVQSVTEHKQERRGGAGELKDREKGHTESTRRRGEQTELRDETHSKQERGTSGGQQAERRESLTGSGGADYGKRREREGERRGSRQEHGSQRERGSERRHEERRGSGQDQHASVKGRSGGERDGERRASRQEHRGSSAGGESLKGTGQGHPIEKKSSAAEWDRGSRGERDARESRREGKGELKPTPAPRARITRQEDLNI